MLVPWSAPTGGREAWRGCLVRLLLVLLLWLVVSFAANRAPAEDLADAGRSASERVLDDSHLRRAMRSRLLGVAAWFGILMRLPGLESHLHQHISHHVLCTLSCSQMLHVHTMVDVVGLRELWCSRSSRVARRMRMIVRA